MKYNKRNDARLAESEEKKIKTDCKRYNKNKRNRESLAKKKKRRSNRKIITVK